MLVRGAVMFCLGSIRGFYSVPAMRCMPVALRIALVLITLPLALRIILVLITLPLLTMAILIGEIFPNK